MLTSQILSTRRFAISFHLHNVVRNQTNSLQFCSYSQASPLKLRIQGAALSIWWDELNSTCESKVTSYAGIVNRCPCSMSRSIVRCEKRSRTRFDSEHISPLFRRCFRFCDFVSSLLNVKQCRIPSRRWQGRRSGRLFHSLFRRVKHVTGSKFFDRSVESLSSTRWRRGRKVKENLLVPCSFKYSRNNLLGICLSFFGETFSVTADVRYRG